MLKPQAKIEVLYACMCVCVWRERDGRFSADRDMTTLYAALMNSIIAEIPVLNLVPSTSSVTCHNKQ